MGLSVHIPGPKATAGMCRLPPGHGGKKLCLKTHRLEQMPPGEPRAEEAREELETFSLLEQTTLKCSLEHLFYCKFFLC